MSISTSLRRAAKLQEKIEELRGQLAGLLDKARAELNALTSEEVVAAPRRGRRPARGKQTDTVKESGLPLQTKRGAQTSQAARPAKAVLRSRAKRRSPLAGHKRASSPTGPLAPAVVKILAQKNKPMNVRDILDQLLADGYQFNTPEPKRNLAARIYRLKGVQQVSPGLFGRA